MRLIFVSSPYSANPEANTTLAETLCRRVIVLGFLPIAPHLYLPRFLDDGDQVQREVGLSACEVLLGKCSEIWIHSRHGVTAGMKRELEAALEMDLPIIIDPSCWNGVVRPIGVH